MFLSSWIKRDFHRFSKRNVRSLKEFLETNKDRLTGTTKMLEILKNENIFAIPKELLAPSPITVAYDTLGNTYSDILLHFHTYEIADQLTKIDWNIYSRIPKKELRQLKWEKPIEVTMGFNVAKLIQRLNKLAHWVATLVLLPATAEERAEMKTHFIGVAEKLLQRHNYGSFMGILTGLNMVSTSRLKLTDKAMLPRVLAKFETLCKLQDPTSSFGTLRSKMKESGSQVLPYIGTFLADMTLIDEGNPETVSVALPGDAGGMAKLPNFPKYGLVYKAIKEFQQFQKVAKFGGIRTREPLLTVLTVLPHLGSEELYNLSLKREPRQQTA